MKEQVIVSLEILLLNDLLHTGAIDRDLYDTAAKKLTEQMHDPSVIQDQCA